MSPSLVSARWDAEYRKGRYGEDPPLPFADEILATLRADSLAESMGLYVGCGNGRNYLPLVRSGLRLYGLDLSAEALVQTLGADNRMVQGRRGVRGHNSTVLRK